MSGDQMESDRIQLTESERIAGDLAISAFLENSHLCKGLERDLLNHLCATGLKHIVPAGQDIICEGEPGDRLYLVLHGTVEVVTHKGDTRIELAQLSKGAFFGEVGLLTGKPRTATVCARDDVTLISFSRKDLEPVLRTNIKLRKRLQAVMTARAKDTISKTAILLLGLLLLFSGPARADGFNLAGRWWTPLGVVQLIQNGKKVQGTVSGKCAICPFPSGEPVFQGVLLDDSVSGKVRYCLKGKGCTGDGWAPLVMLVAREGKVLSGAAHFKSTECRIGGKGTKDGIVMRKLRKTPAPRARPKTQPEPVVGTKLGGKDDEGNELVAEVDPQDPKAFEKNQPAWQMAMEAGAGHMQAGFFERARREFFKATELDPTRPEAFNGIGVTYYARNDYQEALRWYKKALEVGADFGDAYYNMACIYAVQRKKEMAFRYLNIAALNGFVQPQVLKTDPDLNNLRDDGRFADILKKMKAKAR